MERTYVIPQIVAEYHWLAVSNMSVKLCDSSHGCQVAGKVKSYVHVLNVYSAHTVLLIWSCCMKNPYIDASSRDSIGKNGGNAMCYENCAVVGYYAASGNFFIDVSGQPSGPFFKGQESKRKTVVPICTLYREEC